jgi:FYVE/RhoGEF/PH domain-containing protein 5/6
MITHQTRRELEIKVTQTEVRHARIGEVFLKFLPFFKTYTLYVNNYETIQKTIKHLQDKDDDFKIWLAKQARDPRLRGLGLDSYQIMPIQRIPRYELLLKELVSNTDETHPDFPNLKRAVGEVHTIANLINEQKKLSENMMKMLQIQNLMGAKCA